MHIAKEGAEQLVPHDYQHQERGEENRDVFLLPST
jgi:hypothetical protein